MKITRIDSLVFSDIKVIGFAHFPDDRGFFSEPFRKSDLINHVDSGSIAGKEIVQINESMSNTGVMRGVHFQWSPFMGKLVRTISGHMVDMFLDIRKGSPSFGKISMYDMPSHSAKNYSEWIWIPPGFAHGNFFLEPTHIEYLCTGEYSPDCEAGISPLSPDLDWSQCDTACKAVYDNLVNSGLTLSEKDEHGLTLSQWREDPRSSNFVYGEC